MRMMPVPNHRGPASAFLRLISRILALCNALEVTFTVSYEVPSLIMRIRDGIAAQSTHILSWFATANGGNAHYCYSRFL